MESVSTKCKIKTIEIFVMLLILVLMFRHRGDFLDFRPFSIEMALSSHANLRHRGYFINLTGL